MKGKGITMKGAEANYKLIWQGINFMLGGVICKTRRNVRPEVGRLRGADCGYKKLAIFITNVDAEH
jgi:hypothetical protein